MNYTQTAIQIKKKTELMQNSTKQSGFSLLELMIVFVLIAMLGAFVVPNIFKRKSGVEQKQFLSSLETMLKHTVVRAVLEQQVHQIYFDIKQEIIQVRIHDAKSVETKLHKQFTEVNDPEFKTHIPFLKEFKIKNFFINGNEEVFPGRLLEDVLFYIMPDGTSQPVVVNIVHENDDAMQDVNFSFVINPFYARMSVYETFQTP
jgi:prepilin-type N-terminal cleavage/methylation domain-containing protein